jgi:hypothetical protein
VVIIYKKHKIVAEYVHPDPQGGGFNPEIFATKRTPPPSPCKPRFSNEGIALRAGVRLI